MDMEKTYQPQSFEQKIYDYWMKNKFFEAHVNKKKEPFTIMMPPPNVTGQLHMGHALGTQNRRSDEGGRAHEKRRRSRRLP